MRRSLPAIIVMGILAVAALGLGASYLMDRSPAVRSLARFKAEAARDPGVREVAVRVIRGEEGRTCLVTVRPASPPESEAGARAEARRIAELLAAGTDPGFAAETVEVELLGEPRVGCAEERALYGFAWRIAPLRRHAAFRQAAEALSIALAREMPGLEAAVSTEGGDRGDRTVIVRVGDRAEFGEARTKALLARARDAFSRIPYREIRLVDGAGAVLGRYRFYGRRIDAEVR